MKILVIALAGIGDCLIATPLFHELRLHYPDAQLDALVFWKGSRELLENNPHINTVFEKNLVKLGHFRAIRHLRSFRRESYDISINAHPQGRFEYRLAAGLIGAPLRLSHRYERHRFLDPFFINRSIEQDYTIHSIENNNRLLGLLGVQPRLAEHFLEVYLTPEETAWAEQFITGNQLDHRQRLGIHVGSGGTKNLALKRWPLEHYIALLRQVTDQFPKMTVLLFGGPEEEKAHQEILAALPGRPVMHAKTGNLRQAAALMRHCDAFLSVDTALMHLASAMRVPNQIVIEAPTLNPTNLPRQRDYTVVPNPMVAGRNLDYYRYDGRNIQGTVEHLHACMASVTVDTVFAAVSKVAARMPSRS